MPAVVFYWIVLRKVLSPEGLLSVESAGSFVCLTMRVLGLTLYSILTLLLSVLLLTEVSPIRPCPGSLGEIVEVLMLEMTYRWWCILMSRLGLGVAEESMDARPVIVPATCGVLLCGGA